MKKLLKGSGWCNKNGLDESFTMSPHLMEEFAQIGSSLLGHQSAVDGVNIEILWIGAVSACD